MEPGEIVTLCTTFGALYTPAADCGPVWKLDHKRKLTLGQVGVDNPEEWRGRMYMRAQGLVKDFGRLPVRLAYPACKEGALASSFGAFLVSGPG